MFVFSKGVEFCKCLVLLQKINSCILVHQLSFDAAATAHPEQAERVEGGRRGFAQDEHGYINTTLFLRKSTRMSLKLVAAITALLFLSAAQTPCKADGGQSSSVNSRRDMVLWYKQPGRKVA